MPEQARAVEIVPAILAKSLKEITEQAERVRGAVKHIQIDLVDGHFAHNKTWPYRDEATFAELIANDRGLPFSDEFNFEFDLMIENPQARATEVARAMASRIVVHAQAPGALEALKAIADMKTDDYGEYSVTVGLALLPSMQPDVLDHFEGLLDFVQVMGIARPGFQGEPFDKRALYLVERLRARNPGMELQVDGAVTRENAHALASAGANRLVVGHDIWEAEDSKAEIAILTQLANAH